MEAKNIKKALETLRDRIVDETRFNLIKAGKGGGTLENSVFGTDIKKDGSDFSFEILMEEYGKYQDKGVSGVLKKYNTPYSYKDKMPPPAKLDKWMIKKGVAPRDESGKFLKRKSLQFLIARGIYRYGIKPSLFFTNAYKDVLKDFKFAVESGYQIDVEDLLEYIIKKNKLQ